MKIKTVKIKSNDKSKYISNEKKTYFCRKMIFVKDICLLISMRNKVWNLIQLSFSF